VDVGGRAGSRIVPLGKEGDGLATAPGGH
jgi:hypothetical protein